jgi:hypothetical protein
VKMLVMKRSVVVEEEVLGGRGGWAH